MYIYVKIKNRLTISFIFVWSRLKCVKFTTFFIRTTDFFTNLFILIEDKNGSYIYEPFIPSFT